jgi:hypothetical protein
MRELGVFYGDEDIGLPLPDGMSVSKYDFIAVVLTSGLRVILMFSRNI